MKTRPYRIHFTEKMPEGKGHWDGAVWKKAEVLQIAHFHSRSSDHHPVVRAKVLHSQDSIHVIFKVKDRYVRSVTTKFQGPVCTDSCVEFFVKPRRDRGYLNFEVNCGGTLLVYYIEDPTLAAKGGFRKFRPVKPKDAALMKIYHSLPRKIAREMTRPVTWFVEYSIPFKLIEKYTGPVRHSKGAQWRANFYKCADHTSHPHWASWAPIGKKLAFHQPKYFRAICFE